MFGYLDDHVLVSDKTNAEVAFRALYDLLLELGLPINPKKVCPPAKCMPCLGIYFNLNNFSIAINFFTSNGNRKIVEIQIYSLDKACILQGDKPFLD